MICCVRLVSLSVLQKALVQHLHAMNNAAEYMVTPHTHPTTQSSLPTYPPIYMYLSTYLGIYLSRYLSTYLPTSTYKTKEAAVNENCIDKRQRPPSLGYIPT